jgi:hypothetical protein
MSVVEDVRQVIQDFLAPELRALTARIDALEVKMDSRFEAIEAKMEGRFGSSESKAESRFEAVNSRLAAIEERAALRHELILSQIESIRGQLSLDYRVRKLEQAQEDARA